MDTRRSAALLAAALLDAQLESLFRARLKHHQDCLLGFDGLLATFSTRIKVARALGWIDEEVESDLDVIRNIRNRFAHSFEQDLRRMMDRLRESGVSTLPSMDELLSRFVDHEPIAFARYRVTFFMCDIFPEHSNRFPVEYVA